jgi:hypothetical protein
MKSLLALLFLVCLSGAVVAQQYPETKREMGEDYRFIWSAVQAANDTIVIRFPRKDNLGDEPIPVSPDSILTTTLGSRTVRFVEVQQFTRVRQTAWVIWSPCFPAGSDTVFTSVVFPTYRFSGCTVDSVEVLLAFRAGSDSTINLQLFATD